MTKVDFDAFKGKVEGRGYSAKSDGSMYYVVTGNGIKVEFKQGRTFTYTVGYGKSRLITDALLEALKPIVVLSERKPAGHFNLVGEGLDKFVSICDAVEKVELPRAERKASAERAPKAKGPRLIKAKPIKLVDKPKVTDKTVEELADIRAKNLARLKAVGRKYAKGQVAAARFSDEPFDDSAVANLEAELDSFKAPAFLTKDEVKYLV